jgi:signal peptidase I
LSEIGDVVFIEKIADDSLPEKIPDFQVFTGYGIIVLID